jgi:hypothetical protein
MRVIRAALVAALTLAGGSALAQPMDKDHHDDKDRDRHHDDKDRDKRDHDHDHDMGPGSAPPAPQAENPGAKPGFEWVGGRWDWKDGKWTWMAGRWEKEHAGQHWRAGHWDQKGTAWSYTEGDWGPAGAAPTAPPPPPGMGGPPMGSEEHHRDWKVDRPTVSSYWPSKGKPGAHVKVHGRNFPDDIQVFWGETQITAAKVKPDEISFDVPAGAASGDIVLRRAHGRDLPVGHFDIDAHGDYEAEMKRVDDDRRKKAEADWAGRQHDIAKDRAAREAASSKWEHDQDASREQRRQARLTELRAKWDAAFLADADTQSELTLHAQRVAELDRAKQIAELKDDGKLAQRVTIASSKEDDRHDQRMSALKASFTAKGGRP